MKKYDVVDFDGNVRTVENSASDCALRCEKTTGCVGSSWWLNDGGCHLAASEAILIQSSLVTSYFCSKF